MGFLLRGLGWDQLYLYKVLQTPSPLVILRGRSFFLAPKNPRDVSACQEAGTTLRDVSLSFGSKVLFYRVGILRGQKEKAAPQNDKVERLALKAAASHFPAKKTLNGLNK